MDITRNVFFWFRGPSHGRVAAAHRAQLENNLTKAFVSVLEHCDRQIVLRAFLRRLGLALRRDVAFSLQRRPAIAETVKQRVVVGITGGAAEIHAGRAAAEAGRPDAWIFSDKWAVLVESKIGKKLSEPQLRAHAKAVGWEPGSYRLMLLAWQDVHQLCKAAKRRAPKKDAVSHLLLRDWVRYLEHQNMTEFDRLEEIDFDFLGLPTEERRAMLAHLRRRMHAFARLLGNRPVAKQIAALYSKRKTQDWKYSDPKTFGTSYWFNIGGDPSPGEWHATLFYRPAGLSLELLNSRNHLVRQLCKRGIDCFREIVEMAGRHENVYVGCRRAWYRDPASSYKGQHIAWADQPILVAPSALDVSARESYAIILRNALTDMLSDKRFRTELNVSLAIPRKRLLGLPIRKQVTAVARALRTLKPVLAFLLDEG